MDKGRSDFDTPFNAVAAFPDEAKAGAAVALLTARGVPADAVRLTRPDGGDEEIAELRAEMQDEVEESWGGPAFFMTGSQAKGAFMGTAVFVVVGLVAGVVIGLAWAYLVDADLSRVARVAIAVVLSTVAFATAGFIAGGSMEPRAEAASDPERPMDDRRAVAERDVLVGVHAQERETVERSADLLRQLGAERVDLVDANGTPLPPQHEHPRPADPDDWWWRRAGHG